MALIIVLVTGGVAALIAMAFVHMRITARALMRRDWELMQKSASFAARALHYAVQQEEGEILRKLDTTSLAALRDSVQRLETELTGLEGVVFLEDGQLVYPLDRTSASEAVESPRDALVQYLRANGQELMARLARDGVCRLHLPGAAAPLVASLFLLKVDTTAGCFGICWSAWFLEKWWLTAAKEAAPPGCALEVADNSGRAIFLAHDGRMDAAGEGFYVAAALPPESFPWSVRIRQGGVSKMSRELRSQLVFYSSALAVAVVVTGLAAAALVVTTMKEMELVRMKSDFVANISHELRTPLALIRGAADTLSCGRRLEEATAARYLTIIRKESDRLTDLIDTVMKFSHLERRGALPEFDKINLCEHVRNFVASYGAYLKAEGFTVHTRIPDEPVYVAADAEALRLVLVNLVSNAVKFSGERREIEIAVQDRPSEVAFSVTDRGIGISLSERARIFEPFFRAERDLVKKTRGAGLGLALVRSIVQAHHGRVEVQSVEKNGSVFTVWLPKAEAAQRGGMDVMGELS